LASIVIVHGMWSGGWLFQPIARMLRRAGHEAFTPTLTGVGEREHLGSPETGLETHVTDVMNVLEFEDLRDVMLVGYSYGGMVITVVADRVPERVGQLVYLDAWVPRDGQAVADIVPEAVEGFIRAAMLSGEGWRVPRDPPAPRRTTHPLRSLIQPAVLRNEAAMMEFPRTYIRFTGNSLYHAPVMARIAADGAAAGWRTLELDADHDAPETHPRDLAGLLLSLL